jgi:GNAT superfamily N-acetyltransferase
VLGVANKSSTASTGSRGTGFEIRPATAADWPGIYPFWSAIVEAGETYAYPEGLSSTEAAALWMEESPGLTVVAVDTAQAGSAAASAPGGPVLASTTPGRTALVSAPDRPVLGSAREEPVLESAREVPVLGSTTGGPILGPAREVPILGSAKMGPNRPGRGSHIATASFMVDQAAQGRGVGRALGEYVVAWARREGYQGIQFNAVVETNAVAMRLWQSLGFQLLATVPGAFEHRTFGRVGLNILYMKI